jgi:hypothetical protein
MFISRKAVIAGVSTLVLVGGAAAYAVFTTQGEGEVTTTVSSIDDDSFAVTAELPEDRLYPGVTIEVPITASYDENQSVPLTVKNFSGTELDVEPVEGGDCAADLFTFKAESNGNVVRPGATDRRVGTLEVTLKNSADNGCQGADVTVALVANAESVVL